MNLFKPTDRLSRLDFSLYTLAYYVFVLAVGFIIFVIPRGTGSWSGSGGWISAWEAREGGWIGLLMGLVLFLLYLHYLVRPRIRDMGHSQWWALTLLVPVVNLCAMLVLLLFPVSQSANQGSTKGIRKIVTIGVGLLAAPIILGFGLWTAYSFLDGMTRCPLGFTGCESRPSRYAAVDRDVIQTAIDVMMAVNELSSVRASTSGHGGEIIRSTGTQFHPTLDLQDYLRQPASEFCYRWAASGLIIFQYDVVYVDGKNRCAIDAEQLYP